MDVKWYYLLKSPVVSPLIKILKPLLNGFHENVKLFKILNTSVWKKSSWSWTEPSLFSLNISHERIILTFIWQLSLMSLKTKGLALCIGAKPSTLPILSCLAKSLDALANSQNWWVLYFSTKSFHSWGWSRISKMGGSKKWAAKGRLLWGGGHAPPGNFEIQVLGNAISSVLRNDGGRFNTLTKHLFLKLIC